MARYFVTGATGFLGSELVKQLIGRGHRIAALIRTPAKATLLKTLGVELFTGDITDRESLRAPMQGCDGVFHVAAWYKIGVRNGAAVADRVNAEGTRNVLDIARELAIPRIVYTSSVVVLGDTRGRVVDESHYSRGPFLTAYDRSKWNAHYEVALPMMRDGAPIIIAMPGTIYGPGDSSAIYRSLVQLLRGRLFVTPRATAFSWTYVADAARGLRQAMDAGVVGESYLLTGPVHTVQEVFAMAARIAGRRPPPIHPRPMTLRILAAVAGLFERRDLRFPYSSEELRFLAGTTWLGSSAKAQQALGFSARPVEEGLRHTIEHELRQLGMS